MSVLGAKEYRTTATNTARGIARETARQIPPRQPRPSNGRATFAESDSNVPRAAVSERWSARKNSMPLNQARQAATSNEAPHGTPDAELWLRATRATVCP